MTFTLATDGYGNHPSCTRTVNREYLQTLSERIYLPLKNLIMPNQQEKGAPSASGLEFEDLEASTSKDST